MNVYVTIYPSHIEYRIVGDPNRPAPELRTIHAETDYQRDAAIAHVVNTVLRDHGDSTFNFRRENTGD